MVSLPDLEAVCHNFHPNYSAFTKFIVSPYPPLLYKYIATETWCELAFDLQQKGKQYICIFNQYIVKPIHHPLF